MSGMLTNTVAAVRIINKIVWIAQKIANDEDELDKAMFELELANHMQALPTAFPRSRKRGGLSS